MTDKFINNMQEEIGGIVENERTSASSQSKNHTQTGEENKKKKTGGQDPQKNKSRRQDPTTNTMRSSMVNENNNKNQKKTNKANTITHESLRALAEAPLVMTEQKLLMSNAMAEFSMPPNSLVGPTTRAELHNTLTQLDISLLDGDFHLGSAPEKNKKREGSHLHSYRLCTPEQRSKNRETRPHVHGETQKAIKQKRRTTLDK